MVRARRMTRRFDPHRPVPASLVRDLLALAVRAPSAGFSQGWDFVVLTDRADRDAFWSVTTTSPEASPDKVHPHPEGEPAETDERMRRRTAWLRGVRTAPCLIVCCSNKSAYLARYAEPDKGWDPTDTDRWVVPYWHVDVGMAAMVLLLAAQDAGLGALFFGVPAERHTDVLRAFGIPENRTVVGIVALGEPAGPRSAGLSRRRRPIDSVIHAGRFRAP